MTLNVEVSISSDEKDISVLIKAPEKNEQVEKIIQKLAEHDEKEVVGNQNGAIYFVMLEEIISFYTNEKKVFFKTNKGEFEINYRMYEIEEKIASDSFIRISNGVIVNINHVKCFDTAQVGNIIVRFDDGSFEYVSKRRIPSITKFLRNRGKENEK